MQFPDSFFEDEVRDGFYVPALMKRSWAALMEVLSYIAKVCEKHHILWFADFGTLLGAVRHGGFIPWDDDLDICMLRDDWLRFREIARRELPPGYYIPQELHEDYRLQLPVQNNRNISWEKTRLEKFHGFPFTTGVDIFALDYVAPDPEDEKLRKDLTCIVNFAAARIDEDNQNTEQVQGIISQIEDMLAVDIDRSRPVRPQLLDLRDSLFALYTGAEGCTQVASMHHWANGEPWIYPLDAFRNPVKLPFETMEVYAPSCYDMLLTIQFGDYMKFCRTGSAHNYPIYETQKKKVIRLLGEESLPCIYRFSADDLKKKRIKGKSRMWKPIEDFLQAAEKIDHSLPGLIRANDTDTAKSLLESCQQSAVLVGTALEETGWSVSATVGFLEEYCAAVGKVYEMLAKPERPCTDMDCRLPDDLLTRIGESSRHDVHERREVIFLVWKASFWNSFEPYWRQAENDPNCDVYVIPVPCYYKNRQKDGLSSMCCESLSLPDYVRVTDYRSYDPAVRQPDIIFIQNPYDEYNLTLTVHPAFYSRVLKQYTDQLVYIPPFALDGEYMEDPKTIANMKYYVTMPGVIHADTVVVPSDTVRRAYIDFLMETAAESPAQIWEETITCNFQIPFLKTR